MRIAGNEGPRNSEPTGPADDSSRTGQASHASAALNSTSHSCYTPASNCLQQETRTERIEYFTDANFRIFCYLVCSEQVLGHAVR
ncbi:BQ2448_7970 [Microbotryum intermedium]|uniref:BQ2448_7970 protein n=1 Tax=Microbotryum intermedium TaxID=269621 RepID=A0A238FRV6_9BASI|nr:BQ2448_7970 [Microbotryum intermedium]